MGYATSPWTHNRFSMLLGRYRLHDELAGVKERCVLLGTYWISQRMGNSDAVPPGISVIDKSQRYRIPDRI
jgi:hypothetical protein